jgi:hypothetical protein
MRETRPIPIISIVIAVTLSLTGATTTQQTDAGNIEGFVRRSDTIGPVANAEVSLIGFAPTVTSELRTRTE